MLDVQRTRNRSFRGTAYPNQRRSPHIRIPLTVHTTLFSATQPASISPHTPPPTQNTYSLFLVSQPASISPYTHPTHNTWHLILCDPTSVNLLTYTPPQLHTASFSYPNQRRSPHIHIPLHTTLFSATQPAVISSHTTPPSHNTYSLFLVSQPASISPHTLCLFFFPCPTLCVGVGAWNSW